MARKAWFLAVVLAMMLVGSAEGQKASPGPQSGVHLDADNPIKCLCLCVMANRSARLVFTSVPYELSQRGVVRSFYTEPTQSKEECQKTCPRVAGSSLAMTSKMRVQLTSTTGSGHGFNTFDVKLIQ
jgi:hypothetical protein